MVAAAAMVVLFLIIAAVVLNVGWWLRDKRDAQNDVDAAVLAGAQELPDEVAAESDAEKWAADNGAGDDLITPCEFVDMTGDGAADLIRCTVEREPGLLVGNLLDVGNVTVTAKAAAARMRAVAGCVAPWAVLGNPAQGPPGGTWGLTPDELYIFHTKDFTTPGNFGALALYGNGATDYKEAIEKPCGSGAGACDQTDPQVPVGETLQCEAKTGNMGQNTDDALTNRYGTSLTCDATTYDDAVGLADTVACQDRALLIPIIVAWPPKGNSGPVEILGLATFYIASWDREAPYGNVDVNGDTVEDDAMVWGYFLQEGKVVEAWNIQWGYSDDPFAPITILLVE